MSVAIFYRCRELIKRRLTGTGGFELHVPELDIRAGEVLILRGASGCGKSTLLDLLALALRPDEAADFRFQPHPATPVDVRQCWAKGQQDRLAGLRRRHIGYILQTGGLLPFLSVRDNIALTARLLGLDPTDAIASLAERLDIASLLDRYPSRLSLGERQRVAIARAMAHQPYVILADEPTASLDPLNAQIIRDLLLELVQVSGAAAVIATHDWEVETLTGVRVLQHRLARVDGVTRSYFRN